MKVLSALSIVVLGSSISSQAQASITVTSIYLGDSFSAQGNIYDDIEQCGEWPDDVLRVSEFFDDLSTMAVLGRVANVVKENPVQYLKNCFSRLGSF